MRFLLFPFFLALSACSLTPELVKPAAPAPERFAAEYGTADQSGNAAELGWRTMFGDPRLQRLIEHSLSNNRDLRIAALKVEAFEAEYGVKRAARLPALDGTAHASREPVDGGSNGDIKAPGGIQQQVGFGVGLSAFEIDLFGRVRSLSEAAFARYLASEQGRRSAQLSLVATVAKAYFAERLAQGQLALAERTLSDWRQSLELARMLKQAEQNSALDVAQAEGQVATAEADREDRRRAVAQAVNALELLVGAEMPAPLPDPIALTDQPVVTHLPAGLPSDLLLRRPDILQAEQKLVAANADVGAARAAFFPRLSLTASLGFASPAMSGLFDGDHRTWRFAPQLTLPLFHGGRLRSELRLSEVRKSTAIAEYEIAIQTAFKEVSDGLAGQSTYRRQIDAQARIVATAERRLQLSTLRYQSGLEGRIELLDAQRTLYTASKALLTLRRDQFVNAVALYKALGGGLNAESGVSASGSPPVRSVSDKS